METQTKANLLSVLSGILLAGSLVLWSVVRQTPHLEKMAAELGSIPHYLIGIYPNHSGSSFLYFEETEHGLGAFLGATATGKSRLLYEEPEQGYHNRFRLLDWSADDSVLIYATMSNPGVPDGAGAIHVCNGVTGEAVTNFPADAYAGDSQFAWLSPSSFIYSTYTHRSWLAYAQQPDGTWAQTQTLKRFGPGKLPQVAGTSPHSVAWLQGQTLWTYDFVTGEMGKIWEATNKLTGLSYSAKTGNYQLTCQDDAGPFLVEFRPPRLGEETGTMVNLVRPPPEKPSVIVDANHGRPMVKIKATPGAEATTLVWDGMLQYYNLGGNSLFFTGNRSDGLPGVWQFDLPSQTVRQISSARKTPFQNAKTSHATTGVFTNRDGRVMSYHLWPPVTGGQGRKHPIVIGEGIDDWQQYPELAANSGWFYAQADLTGWNISKFPDDVACLCNWLSQNPEVDTNKVVFIAFCAQTVTVPRLVQDHPALARGLVLSYPFGITPSTRWNVSHVLILGGIGDSASPTEEVLNMHDAAWNAGIDTSLLMLDGVQHISRSAGAEREQGRQFARFLSQNK
jgi:hypothetical protein